MSTRSSIFYGTDKQSGTLIHIYREMIDDIYYIDVNRADGFEYDEIECSDRLLEALGIVRETPHEDK